MAQLVIDIGNTKIKAAVFNGYDLIHVVPDTTLPEWYVSVLNEYNISKAITVSVKKEVQPWQQQLEQQVACVVFDRHMAHQINNHYRTPQTLGLDRLAAVMGAMQSHPKQDNLIIDAGTCITYDYVDAGANYFGGSISPGLTMRYRAVNHYTSALPLVAPDIAFNGTYGDDTISAIRSGVQNGIIYEIQGFIQTYTKQAPRLNIILTGGDSDFLDTALKNSIFARYIKTEPYLVLKGLNAAILSA